MKATRSFSIKSTCVSIILLQQYLPKNMCRVLGAQPSLFKNTTKTTRLVKPSSSRTCQGGGCFPSERSRSSFCRAPWGLPSDQRLLFGRRFWLCSVLRVFPVFLLLLFSFSQQHLQVLLPPFAEKDTIFQASNFLQILESCWSLFPISLPHE